MTKFSFIKKVKLNTKFPLIRQISLLIAILLLLVIAAFAWFIENDGSADANGLNISMSAGKNMEISLDDGKTFHTSIDILSDEVQSNYVSEGNRIKDKLKMQDITSDGLKFWRPEFSEEQGERIPDTEKTWKQATRNEAYISQTVLFKTPMAADIYLGSDTEITTYCEDNDKELVGSDTLNKSSKGDFSKDCIVGALRISAYEDKDVESPLFLCIPRYDITLSKDDDDNYNVTIDNTVSDEKMLHEYYQVTKDEDGNQIKELTETNNVILNFDEPQKLTTTQLTENGDYCAYATVNIWLEGCDAETRRALSGGQFSIYLDFYAVTASE